jgi:hypothetical protein
MCACGLKSCCFFHIAKNQVLLVHEGMLLLVLLCAYVHVSFFASLSLSLNVCGSVGG